MTRKAIQDVEVQRAVNKIIHPGAPIALRLQGSLLFGLSRVYDQQCRYVLVDAEKVKDNMRLAFRSIAQNQTDPRAGKAK
jgi:hypothetical protein